MGVNSDSIIKKTKGPTRPFNKIDERLAILSHNKDIDYVFSFDFENAYEIVSRISPDVYFQGREYENKLPREEAICEVLYLTMDEKSTTALAEKIINVNKKKT